MLHDLSYLPRQDRRRIEAWTEELRNQLYHPLGLLSWKVFFTYEHLGVEEARQRQFSPIEEGTRWGAKGEYGWFAASFVVEPAWQDLTLCSPLGIGGEMLIYFDGNAIGSIDRHHKLAYFSYSAEKGPHTILVEAYAGSGVLLEGGGPQPPERPVYPPVAKTQQQISSPSFGYLDEDAYGLLQDVYTLTSLLKVLQETSLQAESIVSGLLEFTKVVDFEVDLKQRRASYRQARALLSPLLAAKNGSIAPTFSVFGQSHIDLAWKWPVSETRRKVGRTYANQLSLLDRFPSYRFLLCEPALVRMLQEYHPKLYGRVLKKIEEGSLYAEGAFWVECDTNIPSAESLVQQLVWGQRWFKRVRGEYSTFAWLPDTFGFSASLPQLLLQAQVKSFGTQKLLRSDPESETFPFTTFWWEGEDGSRVLSNMSFRNNCEITPEQLYQRWHIDRKQKQGIDSLLYPFGYGDGGGGPDRDMIEQLLRLEDLQGLARLEKEGPQSYFDRIGPTVRLTHQGELYLAWHRGTYSAQHWLKQLNRQAEESLEELSFWTALSGAEWPHLTKWWETVLFNQFHDILAGVSIRAVNEQARTELEGVVSGSTEALHDFLLSKSIPRKGTFSLFNRLAIAHRKWVLLPEGASAQQEGEQLPSCPSDEGLWVLANLPACGSALVTVNVNDTPPVPEPLPPLAEELEAGFVFKNAEVQFLVDRRGRVVDLTYQGRQVCSYANELRLFKDVNPDYDAWELGRMAEELPCGEAKATSMKLIQNSPHRSVLRIEQGIGSSVILQELSFSSHSNRLDFSLEVMWSERHKLLKSSLCHTLGKDQYVCDTQLSYKTLPSHRNTQNARDRYEVCAQRYTAFSDEHACLLVLGSHPYGISVQAHEAGMSLLRSPLIPDDSSEQGLHRLSYGLEIVSGPFLASVAARHAALFAHRCPVIPGWVAPAMHMKFSGQSVEVVHVGRSEDGSLLIRLVQQGSAPVVEQLTLGFPVGKIDQSDLLEENRYPLQKEEGVWMIPFTAFELKTLILS